MYFITLLNLDDREAVCFGYYETLAEALDVVTNNRTDLHEAYYTHAVIEKILPGLYRAAVEFYCFEYDLDTETFKPVEPPELLKRYRGWSIAIGQDISLARDGSVNLRAREGDK